MASHGVSRSEAHPTLYLSVIEIIFALPHLNERQGEVWNQKISTIDSHFDRPNALIIRTICLIKNKDLIISKTFITNSTLSDLIPLMQRRENGQSALADLSFETTALAVGGRGIFFPSW